jgi:ribonuclease HI
VLRYKEHCRELSGHEQQTTNNRMEMKAVIEGLTALKEPCDVVVRTDSQYLRDGITLWIRKWKTNHWLRNVKGQGKQPVRNRDLWEEMDRLQQLHHIEWQWVKGHADDQDNNRCDVLANSAARMVS